MTIEELAKLSDEELRVMCAELIGADEWAIVKRGLYYRPHGRGYTSHLNEAWKLPYAEAKTHEAYVDRKDVSYDEKIFIEKVPPPNYPADLNAMHEVIATLTDEELTKVACLLRRMSANDPDDPEATLWDAHGWPGLLKASPRQIGIAFIAVKQQPVEVKGGGE